MSASEEPVVRFDDGAAYENFMGVWSRLAGDVFIDWLAPSRGLAWLDVGCGNGAFTATLIERCAPARVDGIDPSPEQIDYARSRPDARTAHFRTGDAMDLPYDDDAFDAAVQALVIFFVPDPAKSVAEMARVVRPGGHVSAYAWDVTAGGFPYFALQDTMASLGYPALGPPSPNASKLDVMQALWRDAGLVDLRTHAIEVARTFDDFDHFWATARQGPRLAPRLAQMPPTDSTRLKELVRERLRPDASGRITYGARANAIVGRVPGSR